MRTVGWVSGHLILAGLAWWTIIGCSAPSGRTDQRNQAVAVKVASVEQQTIQFRRRFTGTLESPARFVVAPKVSGRIEYLAVDLSDPVESGQVIARLDDEEFQQAVVQAKANLEVAHANLVEAKSNLEIAEREMARVASLRQRGVATDSQVDSAKAQRLTHAAAVEVAKAQVTRAEAFLAEAKIRLGYTVLTAQWPNGGRRFVAERHLNEGANIVANAPLLTIVELNPMMAVVFVSERDYGLLAVGQAASITTDAFPGSVFPGKVARVAPVFSQASRQARVELELFNQQQLLKPGMFVHAEIVLDQSPDAHTIPFAALVNRDGQDGVFLVNQSGDRVAWKPVELGIQQKDRVEVIGLKVGDQVVTIGQQLIHDGSPIIIPEEPNLKSEPPSP